MDGILDGLNAAQRAAVASPSSILQVLAPPGSGKTKTLTARVAYLLSHNGYRPQDIICCTFTIKASREMRERIGKLVGDEVQSKLVMGTFHSICRRYLVTYGYLIGLQAGFGIADSTDSLAIIRRIAKDNKLNIQPNTARSRISHQKAQGVSPGELAVKNVGIAQTTVERQEFIKLYREYEAVLAASNLLDYDDLLLRCVELLRKHPQCVSNVQAVLVDEFQDTNHIQYELMNLFAFKHKRITIVGDPDQSIYGFRSAEIKNLKRMQQFYRDTSVTVLEDNYRSSASILKCAQDVIEQDVSRPAKKLQPTHRLGTLPVLRILPTATDEAQWIVTEIKRCIGMTGKILDYSDFAVLLRSASLSRQIESEMGKQGVPYMMVGGSRFFDRVEIKLLLDYLRVISHTDNSDALLRIINVPSRRIGEQTIRVLTNGAADASIPLWGFLKDVAQGRRSPKKTLSQATQQGICSLINLIETCRTELLKCRDSSAPKKLLELVIKKLSLRAYLGATYPLDDDSRWANVEELLCQAADTSGSETDQEEDERLADIEGLNQAQAHPGEEALSRFLGNVALATEMTSQIEAENQEEPNKKVTISTIHAAKGLEWPVVFVPAVYEGIIPHSRAEDSDEERRLLYVAMTRAQALLYLSRPNRPLIDGEETRLTSFLPAKIVDKRFSFTGPVFSDKVVFEIAEILHRSRPSPADMLLAIDDLPSVRDDLWTSNGERSSDPAIRWDGSVAPGCGVEEPSSKRRRCNQNQSSTLTTFVSSSAYTVNNASSFSIPSNVLLGFSSARDMIATVSYPDSNLEKPDSKRKPTGGTTTRQAPELSQGTISSFFCQGLSSKTQGSRKPRQHKDEQSQRSQVDKGEYPNDRPDSLSVRTNHSAITPQLASHHLALKSLQLARPSFEPSERPTYKWLATTPQPGEQIPPPPDQENRGSLKLLDKDKKPATLVDTAGNVKGSLERSNGVRPLMSYYHNGLTTLSMQSGAMTGRKTLGIRRSINGWQMKGQRRGGQP